MAKQFWAKSTGCCQKNILAGYTVTRSGENRIFLTQTWFSVKWKQWKYCNVYKNKVWHILHAHQLTQTMKQKKSGYVFVHGQAHINFWIYHKNHSETVFLYIFYVLVLSFHFDKITEPLPDEQFVFQWSKNLWWFLGQIQKSGCNHLQTVYSVCNNKYTFQIENRTISNN